MSNINITYLAENISNVRTLYQAGDAIGSAAALSAVVASTAGVVVTTLVIPRTSFDLVWDGLQGEKLPNIQKKFMAGLLAGELTFKIISDM